MKKNCMKRIFSALIAGLLLLSVLPLSAGAAVTKYTVTYDYRTNGGSSCSQTEAQLEPGADVTVAIEGDPCVTASKGGWTFLGWNTDKDAEEALASLTMGSQNVTLYAIFSKELTATFKDAAGESTDSVTIYNTQDRGQITFPAQGAYDGWETRGWTTGSDPDAQVTNQDGENFDISGNITFYGLYQRDVTLSYDPDGGSTTPADQVSPQYANAKAIDSHTAVKFYLRDSVTKTGYSFKGWKPGSKAVQAAGTQVSIFEDTTAVAVWEAGTYLITFDYQSGYGSPESKTVSYGTSFFTLPTPIRDGYTFSGWYTAPNGAGTKYTATTVGTLTADTTLYAKWTPAGYTVTFDKQGGGSGSNSVTATYLAAMPSISIPVKDGYTFGGYYSETDGNGTKYYNADGSSARTYSLTTGIKLYAKWTLTPVVIENLDDPCVHFVLWGVHTKYVKNFWNWVLMIFGFGWIWMPLCS
jgi:uncharacterized repeat protein (TIGR02543 family)